MENENSPLPLGPPPAGPPPKERRRGERRKVVIQAQLERECYINRTEMFAILAVQTIAIFVAAWIFNVR